MRCTVAIRKAGFQLTSKFQEFAPTMRQLHHCFQRETTRSFIDGVKNRELKQHLVGGSNAQRSPEPGLEAIVFKGGRQKPPLRL
jgi:hypothetical protein